MYDNVESPSTFAGGRLSCAYANVAAQKANIAVDSILTMTRISDIFLAANLVKTSTKNNFFGRNF
jgi:hypothetical protein